MKIKIEDFYYSRLEQIDKDLKQEFYKGKKRNKLKLAQLFKEKTDLESKINMLRKAVL